MNKASRFAKPEAVARVQRGHHGKHSIPRRPAECNQAGIFLCLPLLLPTWSGIVGIGFP